MVKVPECYGGLFGFSLCDGRSNSKCAATDGVFIMDIMRRLGVL